MEGGKGWMCYRRKEDEVVEGDRRVYSTAE
jgi:hypothetical protein